MEHDPVKVNKSMNEYRKILDIVFYDRNTNEHLIEMFKIIDNRRANQLKQVYPVSARSVDYVPCHKHHIIPKCWYRFNDIPVDNGKNNLIVVTVSEHVRIHALLKMYFEEKGNSRMAHAMEYSVAFVCKQSTDSVQTNESDLPVTEKIITDAYRNRANAMSDMFSETIYVNNGKKCFRIKKTDEMPEGFKPGYLVKHKYMWIHNDINEMKIHINEPIPVGYIRGRHPDKVAALERSAPKKGNPTLVRKWFHNGIKQIRLMPGVEPPDGFIPGQLPIDLKYITDGIHSKKIPASDPVPNGWRLGIHSKGKICVNDGQKTIKVSPDQIPAGFVRGNLLGNIHDRIAMSNDKTHHYTMVRKEDYQKYIDLGYVRGNHCAVWKKAGYVRIEGYENKGRFQLPGESESLIS